MTAKTKPQSPKLDLQYLPIFIQGELEFSVESYKLSFSKRLISVFGVTGLPWPPLSPARHFGLRTWVDVRIPPPHNFKFRTEAYIMRETSSSLETMGLRFRITPEIRQTLENLINRFGYYPNEYNRRYPRIPTSSGIGTFPLRVLANAGKSSKILQAPIILDVRNLSVGGMLISTENPYAQSIMPSGKIDLLFEPRGDFSSQIAVSGIIRRVSDEISWESGNVIRYLGVQFTQISSEDRVMFLDLLRDILTQLKQKKT